MYRPRSYQDMLSMKYIAQYEVRCRKKSVSLAFFSPPFINRPANSRSNDAVNRTRSYQRKEKGEKGVCLKNRENRIN